MELYFLLFLGENTLSRKRVFNLFPFEFDKGGGAT